MRDAEMQEGQEERCWEVASQRCPNQGLIAVLTGQHGWREQREMHVLMGGQKGLRVPQSLLWALEIGGTPGSLILDSGMNTSCSLLLWLLLLLLVRQLQFL